MWECEFATVLEKVGLGSSPLLHWQLLIRSGAEEQDITQQPISLWIMSYLSVSPASLFCDTFLYLSLFFFFTAIHSDWRVLKVERHQDGLTHTHTHHTYRTPPVNRWRCFFFFFSKDRPIMKGDCECKRLQGLFKTLKWLKLWFPLGIYGHSLLLAWDGARLTSSDSHLTSPVDRKVACCLVIHCCIIFSLLNVRKCHHGERGGGGGGVGGRGWNRRGEMSTVRELFFM